MEPAKISYSVKASWENDFNDTQEAYAGTCSETSPLEIDLRIWNNKYGITPVEDLKKFNLNLYFEKYEDAALLPFIKIVYNEEEEMGLDIGDRYVVATFLDDVSISGAVNNGTELDIDNYINLKITFEIPEGISLKNRDLKSLFLEIDEL